MAFENLLALVTDEADRNSLLAITQKYPFIRERADLGDQLHELKPRLKKLSGEGPEYDYESKPGLALKELEDWRTWKSDKWSAHQQEYNELKASLEEANSKIVAYEAGEIDMTPEALNALLDTRLKALGLVSSTDLDAKLNEYSEKRVIPSLKNMETGLSNRFEQVYTALTPTVVRHRDEYGEVLDVGKVFAYMTEKGITDPNKAYEEFTAPKRVERSAQQHQAEVEKARKEGLMEGQRTAAASSGRAQPVGSGGSAMPGPLVQRFRQRQAEKQGVGQMTAANAPLGKGIIAAEAARSRFEKGLADGAA